jgi:MFS family permease
VVTRTQLEVGAGAYGALYGCFGLGGAAGALLLSRARARIPSDRLVPVAGGVLAAALVALATVRSLVALFPIMVLGGAASMTVISSFNIAAQSVLPGWVRGRGLAVYLLTFQAGMAAGAALWGALAANAGVSVALVAAGVGMLAVHVLGGLAGLRLEVADRVDLTPAHWAEPQFALEPELSEGPIRVEIAYRIAAKDTPEFVAAMRDVRRTRRRDGAMQWSLYQDLSDPERHVESFLVATWAEHERQHDRAVQSDRAAIERVLALHRGDPPRVSHLLSHDLRRAERRT